MSASTFRVTMIIAAAFALSPTTADAQSAPGVPGGLFVDNYDFQLFEPFDLDLDNVPSRKRAGYFFKAEKLYWAPTSERVTIGAIGVTAPSEVIFPDTANSQGVPPAVYDVINDIQDAPPQSEFGWGDRYEIGYTDHNGVTFHIGILNGLTSTSSQTFGFDPVAVDALGNVTQATPFGFGSVHVNFTSSDPNVNIIDLLRGPRDFGVPADIDDADDDFDAPIEVVVVGPGGEGPGAGDGVPDNIDADINNLVFVVRNINGDIIGFGYDFDDLHIFNIRFEQLNVRSVLETQGVELMKTFQLDNRNQFRRKQNRDVSIGYGIRLFRIKDNFSFGGDVDLFGNTFANTDVDNQLIGPQVRATWQQRRGPWTMGADARFMAALNIQDVGLIGGSAQDARPGGTNDSAVLQPTFTAIGQQENVFSPVVELRLDARYHISQAVALRAGYTATFVDNISRASQLVGYTLPNFTLRQTSQQKILYSGLSFGVDMQF